MNLLIPSPRNLVAVQVDSADPAVNAVQSNMIIFASENPPPRLRQGQRCVVELVGFDVTGERCGMAEEGIRRCHHVSKHVEYQQIAHSLFSENAAYRNRSLRLLSCSDHA